MQIAECVIAWIVIPGTVLAYGCDWYTPPDRWEEPRLFHCPFDEEFASQIALDRCAVPAELPERQLSPNNAYWFVTILPDRTKNGPWDTDVLVFAERSDLLRIRLRDIRYCRDIGWVNEKLLRIRVWWGRICATDLIVDVERQQIIYKEMVWDGTIAFWQFREAMGIRDKADDSPQVEGAPESPRQ